MTARPSLAELDAVTVDGYGTLLELDDPLGTLGRLLPCFDPEAIARAFRNEGEFYRAHAQLGRDAESLARLRAECVAVFNAALGSSLSVAEFIDALRFRVLPEVEPALARLRARGLALAVVANWDYGLHEHLRTHGLDAYFGAVVTSGEAGARKPDPAPFRLALERLRVAPERALHVGDDDDDERGARAAGLSFLPAPLAQAVEALA